jgi:guanine nucleotide-binding protein subunit alpha
MAPGIMCFGKKPIDPDTKRNAEIEKQLRADQKRQTHEVKLLLLGMLPMEWNGMEFWMLTAFAGAGESGKSTVLKQMRVIHAGGFTKTERKQWRAVIFNNLVGAFQTLLSAMEEHGTDFEDEENRV